MDEKRKGEIAYLLLKHHAKSVLSLKEIGNFKRDVGNLTKETGIPQDELLQFGEIITREAFEEQIAAGFKKPVVKVIE